MKTRLVVSLILLFSLFLAACSLQPPRLIRQSNLPRPLNAMGDALSWLKRLLKLKKPRLRPSSRAADQPLPRKPERPSRRTSSCPSKASHLHA